LLRSFTNQILNFNYLASLAQFMHDIPLRFSFQNAIRKSDRRTISFPLPSLNWTLSLAEPEKPHFRIKSQEHV